jgi:exoribonuclease-2
MDPSPLHTLAVEAMRSRGLQPDFPAEVLAAAQAARQAPRESGGAIRDLRELCWFSIDNDDTLDLDQLSVAEPLPAGAVRLRVAVADVDALVPQGGAVDRHAAANTTSVYTAAGVFPMLPEVLSTDLTSLHEGQERLAVVVDMQVQADGSVGETAFYRALVVNRAKLTYAAVSDWLEGDAPPCRGWPTCPGWTASCGCMTARPRPCGTGATCAARSTSTPCPRGRCCRTACWSTCARTRSCAPRTSSPT